MFAISQLQIVQLCIVVRLLYSKTVVVITRNIDTVNKHPNCAGINAGGILVFHIAVISPDGKRFVSDYCSVGKFLVIDRDRVYNGVVYVIHVGAINKLQIVKVDAVSCFCSHHGSCHIHQPEGHASLNAVGRA